MPETDPEALRRLEMRAAVFESPRSEVATHMAMSKADAKEHATDLRWAITEVRKLRATLEAFPCAL